MSFVWTYFQKDHSTTPTTARCSLCNYKTTYNGPTSGMIRHLHSMHSDIEELRRKRKREEPSAKTDTSCDWSLLMKSFATGKVPCKFVENPEFRRFFHELLAQFTLPSAKQLHEHMLDMKDSYVRNLEHRLRGSPSFALITDAFNENSKEKAFFTAHIVFIDESFKRESHFIGILKSSEVVNGTDLQATMNRHFRSFNLRLDNCFATLADGAPDRKRFLKEGLPNVRCAGGILDRVLNEFANQLNPAGYLDFLKNAHDHLDSQLYAHRKELVDEENFTTAPLIESMDDTLKRWGGRFRLLRAYHDSLQYDSAGAMIPYIAREYEEILEVVEPTIFILKRFEKDASYATDFIPSVLAVRERIGTASDYASRMNRILYKHVNDYIKENSFVRAAMVVDPRYAFLPRIFESGWDECVRVLSEDELVKDLLETAVEDDDFMNSFISSRSESTNETPFQAELRAYQSLLSLARPSHTSDPLDFWRCQTTSFPYLSRLAKKYLAPPASSAVAHRIYRRCKIEGQQFKADTPENDINTMFVSILSRMDENWDDECTSAYFAFLNSIRDMTKRPRRSNDNDNNADEAAPDEDEDVEVDVVGGVDEDIKNVELLPNHHFDLNFS